MEDDRLLYPKAEAFRRIGVKNTKGYELIAAGVLDARKSGSATVITAESLRSYAQSLPKMVVGSGQKAA